MEIISAVAFFLEDIMVHSKVYNAFVNGQEMRCGNYSTHWDGRMMIVRMYGSVVITERGYCFQKISATTLRLFKAFESVTGKHFFMKEGRVVYQVGSMLYEALEGVWYAHDSEFLEPFISGQKLYKAWRECREIGMYGVGCSVVKLEPVYPTMALYYGKQLIARKGLEGKTEFLNADHLLYKLANEM